MKDFLLVLGIAVVSFVVTSIIIKSAWVLALMSIVMDVVGITSSAR